MQSFYRYLIQAMWLSWAGYWLVSSWTVKATVRKEPLGSRLLHMVPLLLAFWLLWTERAPGALLNVRIFPFAPWEFWCGAFIAALGLLFAVRARIHIGRNWSGTVTLKENHELVVSGPYALVRHPIYTGLLAAIVGTALARGEWRGVLAVLLAWLAFWRKYRLEERWMTELFGTHYETYRRQVPALLPFSKTVRIPPRQD